MDGVEQHRGSGTHCKALYLSSILGAASSKSAAQAQLTAVWRGVALTRVDPDFASPARRRRHSRVTPLGFDAQSAVHSGGAFAFAVHLAFRGGLVTADKSRTTDGISEPLQLRRVTCRSEINHD